MSDRFSLAGKAAIVTGAGGGIGRAIAVAFAHAGAKVACMDLNRANAEETAKLASGTAIEVDVASEPATKDAVERAVKALGALHILVNGAAANDPTAKVTELDLAAWNRTFGINVGGAFLMSRWAIPHIAAAGGGSIVHIASQLGSVGQPGRTLYCGTKGALINMTKAMAADHAADNIRVNTLSPGAVETERLVHRFGSMAEARRIAGPRHLLQRLGLPEEIASAAVFLASDASSFMTGADLLVDGGYAAT